MFSGFYADFDEKGQAFQWLSTKSDFRLDPLRSDPRCAELVRKVGLPQ